MVPSVKRVLTPSLRDDDVLCATLRSTATAATSSSTTRAAVTIPTTLTVGIDKICAKPQFQRQIVCRPPALPVPVRRLQLPARQLLPRTQAHNGLLLHRHLLQEIMNYARHNKYNLFM
jgi:hypothetical protein